MSNPGKRRKEEEEVVGPGSMQGPNREAPLVPFSFSIIASSVTVVLQLFYISLSSFFFTGLKDFFVMRMATV